MKDEDLLTVSEVARILRVDDTTVRRWANNGDLEAVKLPGKSRHQLRIRRAAVYALFPWKAQGDDE